MAQSIHHVELDMPSKRIWNFVSDMNNWAPLVPGYTEHEIINERQSTWKLHGDIGVVQKDVRVKVRITEWTEPSHIIFELSGSSESWVGDGYFKATPLSQAKTQSLKRQFESIFSAKAFDIGRMCPRFLESQILLFQNIRP